MTARLTDGRLSVPPAPLLVEHVNAVELTDELGEAESFVLIDLAHAVMLTRQGVFDAGQGRAVVGALLALLDGDPARILGNDPEIGTITLHLERYLRQRCGPGGLDIQRARSRIDQNATGLRMADRAGTLAVLHAQLRYAETLLAAAAAHDSVLIPGYTHLQHAQPTTLGHYFNAHYWSASRNLQRLTQGYARLNECSLGGAAHSGTHWPIDRDLTAAYLGFDRPVRNARDSGMSAVDAGAELAATLGLTLSGASRCASDLYYWSSSEVAMVRLHPSLCGTSSMMPQKRNPIALERIRALAGDAAGWGASQLGLLHFAGSTDADQGYVHNRLPGYCRETAGALALLREAVATLELDTDRLAASAGRHWSTSSALADDLVATRGLSYREAHDAVARFITAHEGGAGAPGHAGAPDQTGAPDQIGAGDRVGAPGLAGTPGRAGVPGWTGTPLDGYPPGRLAELLDARGFVEGRTSAGGTSSARRAELSAQAAADLRAHRDAVRALADGVTRARTRLLADAAALVAAA